MGDRLAPKWVTGLHRNMQAAITNRSEVAHYLKHLGKKHESTARAPPRYQKELFVFGGIEDQYQSNTVINN